MISDNPRHSVAVYRLARFRAVSHFLISTASSAIERFGFRLCLFLLSREHSILH